MKYIEDSIYGFIIGDACGVPFEFLERDEFTCTEMIGCNEDSIHQVSIGTWSDDTSLMLCIMDALSEKDEKKYEKYKENCINWLYRGYFTADNSFPFDIGNACRLGINELKTGIRNYHADDKMSNGNGGLMRILPIAFLDIDNDDEIIKYIRLFNKCSHNHIISHVGCLIYIKIIKMLINGSTIENAIRNLNVEEKYKIDHYRRIWDFSILSAKRDEIRSTGYVVDTLEAAIWSFYNSKDYKDAIFTAINLGNDTDTVAAVCGGMAGIIYEIPKNMKSKVKNHKIIKKTIRKFKNRQ